MVGRRDCVDTARGHRIPELYCAVLGAGCIHLPFGGVADLIFLSVRHTAGTGSGKDNHVDGVEMVFLGIAAGERLEGVDVVQPYHVVLGAGEDEVSGWVKYKTSDRVGVL